MGRMQLRMAMEAAQHKIVSLFKTLWDCFWFSLVFVYLMWGPRQPFFQWGPETPKGWTTVGVIKALVSPLGSHAALCLYVPDNTKHTLHYSIMVCIPSLPSLRNHKFVRTETTSVVHFTYPLQHPAVAQVRPSVLNTLHTVCEKYQYVLSAKTPTTPTRRLCTGNELPLPNPASWLYRLAISNVQGLFFPASGCFVSCL